MFDHDVVAVGETAQFFAVASVNGGQIAVAVVTVAIWQRSSESRFSDDLYSMLTANEIVKEQIFQTTSKKIVRSSEKQKSRACVLHIPYVRT